ncbi:unnamed protein product [Onchocerca ochengi]|uniref:Ovule protein n=1 Tax=Onchocerca ochengi TaxID=42157 RepID=A0A182E5T1_ONCOC|nr:unnamed protein product [Onchocerca ochengi]
MRKKNHRNDEEKDASEFCLPKMDPRETHVQRQHFIQSSETSYSLKVREQVEDVSSHNSSNHSLYRI